MTAGLAGYIFKNKMRPRPEWQKTVVVGGALGTDASNPFRILPSRTAEIPQRTARRINGQLLPPTLMGDELVSENVLRVVMWSLIARSGL